MKNPQPAIRNAASNPWTVMNHSAPDHPAYMQNRELSWLRFNQRVLEEAADPSNPDMERLKFIAIFSDNLGEFFMVRVGSLFDISEMSPDLRDNKSGWTAAEQLKQIYAVVPGLIARKERLYDEVCAALAREGVRDLDWEDLEDIDRDYVQQIFRDTMLPVLSPIIIGPRHPVPHFVSRAVYAAALLQAGKDKTALGFLPVPEALPPFVRLPGHAFRFIRTEKVLLQWAPELFGEYAAQELCLISVTRNADLSFDGEKFEDSESDFRSQVSKLLRVRDRMGPVRLETDRPLSEPFLKRLTALIPVSRHQIYTDRSPLNMKYVFRAAAELPPPLAERLLYKPYRPRLPASLQHGDMIRRIQRHDRLLFYPFDSVEPFLRLLTEAAESPDVISIKITIYRLASSSKIARILCRAAENGKEVLALMELRARFDEANNISWSKMLEEAGCQVVYGIEDYKCHSKLCLITLRGRTGPRYVTQIGTGNYNEKTTALDTDLSLRTADEEIGRDAAAFFRNLLVNDLLGEYRRLWVSPFGIKRGILTLIDREIAKGSNGCVCCKINSLTEIEVIRKLREASRAGVHIDLIVRGICCLLPGVPGETENIRVFSIVGRYLEHARIYCFGRGKDAELYLSSADFMTRNLTRRVEIACPVQDPVLREGLRAILDAELRDNVKSSTMAPDGTYVRRLPGEEAAFCSQAYFMENPILPAAEEPAPRRRGFFARWLAR